MSIQKRTDRPDLPWRVRWLEEGRHRSTSFRTRREAVAFEANAGRERVPVQVSTVEEWALRWVDTHGPGWERSTLEQRARVLDRHVLPYLGGAQLVGLTRMRLREWKRDLLRDGRSANTVNSVSRVLSAALTAAADEGLIASNPLLGMRALPQSPSEVVPVPLPVVRAIQEAMPQERDRRVVALMAYAGLRPGEVRALRWADVGERSIWVGRAQGVGGVKVAKSAKQGRAVQIRRELAVEMVVDPAQAGTLVTPGDRGGVLDWHNWANRVWRPTLAGLGVHGFVPYSLRHSYASLRIAEGATVVEVAAEMGHASPVTTLRHYARLFGEVHPSPRT
jgi:integrase